MNGGWMVSDGSAAPELIALRRTGAMGPTDVRKMNRRAVVAELLRQRPATRASISRATGLTATTVSSVVGELVESGVVAETRGESAGGKPPTDLIWRDTAQQIVAVDLSRSAGAITDLRGWIVTERSWEGGHGQGRTAVERLTRWLHELIDAATEPVLGVGIAVPGIVRRDGTILESVALDWHHQSIGDSLERELGLAVQVINDTQSCALGEFWTAGTEAANFATVRIGEGVGAGLVLGGQLYDGVRSSAGEIGHLVLHPDGAPCGCGNRGCVEMVLTEPRIVERLVMASPALGPHDHDAATLFAEAVRRAPIDPDLAAAIDRVGTDLGAAITPIVGVLDIELVMVVGAVSQLGAALLDAAAAAIRRRALPALVQDVTLQYSELGEIGVLVGAAGAAFHAAYGTL